MEKPGRIAVVSSGVHDPAQLDKTPSAKVPYPAWNLPAKLAIGELGPGGENDSAQDDLMRRYSTSKLANMYFTYGLAARLPKGIIVNAFDPGLMPGTGLAREHSGLSLFLWKFVLPRMIPLLRLAMTKNIHKPEESGAALARLISDSALASTNGKYFEGMQEIRSSVDSYDPVRATELWTESAKLTGLSATPL
jgi:NAD(P)-dependent dehydrogenase (short-subunit alcohol dehydrogenase family)